MTTVELQPVLGLTTELIVGSAPPERAGVASAIAAFVAIGLAILTVVVLRSHEASPSEPEPESTRQRDFHGGSGHLDAADC